MNKLIVTAITIIALSISSFSYATEMCQPLPPDRFVKDSYIVAFKAPTDPEHPLIWPVNREQNLLNPNPAPFPEHRTGQSKEELAKTLGINGQVIYILESINAAAIHMDSEEAYKLSLDPRVLRVTQDQIISIPEVDIKIPTCHPVFNEGLLTIPAIDTPDQLGKFQDVVLKPTTDGTWQLVKSKTSDDGFAFAPITKVKVITTRSFPTQIFLKVFGSFNEGCWILGKVLHRFDGKKFEVDLYANDVGGPGRSCTIPTLFTKIIPLPVYGLKAGTYAYSVNDGNAFSGSFKLAVNNKLADGQ